MPAITVTHLTKTFHQKGQTVEALKDISLTIETGDIYGIIGMSGAGKSTLVRCFNYLEKPTSGEVCVEGKNLGTLNEKQLRTERTNIAMIFQHFNLLMQKSVLDNVCFPMQLQRKKKKETRQRAMEAEGCHCKGIGVRTEHTALRRSHQRLRPPDHRFHFGIVKRN